MTNNEKIAKWLGYEIFEDHWHDSRGFFRELKTLHDFENSGADSFTLLPVLVKRGYHPQLCNLYNDYTDQWLWFCDLYLGPDVGLYYKEPKGFKLISQAILSAVLALIEEEQK